VGLAPRRIRTGGVTACRVAAREITLAQVGIDEEGKMTMTPAVGRMVGAATVLIAVAPGARAQTVRGTVLDAANGTPVQMAAVYLLDSARRPVTLAIADSLGRYRLEVPDSAEYYLFAERLGYFEVESPLVIISTRRDYDLDLELRPEPIALDPLEVTVRNEDFIDWWRLEYGVNAATVPGFRLIQGTRLEEAKLRAADNTETLRFLYIPVTHGQEVCVGFTPRPERGGWHRAPPNPAEVPKAQPESCGRLYVDGRWLPNEHIESIDIENIALIATFPGVVHMYTRGFDWTFRGR
jgi:hypothetical protein